MTQSLPPSFPPSFIAVSEKNGGAYSCVQTTERPDIHCPQQARSQQRNIQETSHGIPATHLPGHAVNYT